MPKNYDPHENTYIEKDKNGNVTNIAPCYSEEEDSIVIAAREYEKQQKQTKEEEPQM